MDEVQVPDRGRADDFGSRDRTEFPELNLRTYVRSRKTGRRGVYFFSLDCASWLAVLGRANAVQPAVLPCFDGSAVESGGGDWLVQQPALAQLKAKCRFRGELWALRGADRLSEAGSLEAFLTERYCLFTDARAGVCWWARSTTRSGRCEPAEADLAVNEITGRARADASRECAGAALCSGAAGFVVGARLGVAQARAMREVCVILNRVRLERGIGQDMLGERCEWTEETC